jgi:hypothetical protein
MTASVAFVALALQAVLTAQAVGADTNSALRSAATPGEYPIPDAGSRDLLEIAADEYEKGMSLRHDAEKARPQFRNAARLYDEVWRRGVRDTNLALNRANSHRLAGDLSGAMVALREGLAIARWNRPIQAALEEARSAVAYPTHSDLATLCRPTPSSTIGTRMSPREAQVTAAVLWFLVCAGIVRFAMTKIAWWLGFAGTWLVVLVGLGALWLYDDHARARNAEHSSVVIARDVDLRKGNADTFPLRLDGVSRLPRGVEASELTRRGGWAQIQLASGIKGWVPETCVVKVGR